MTDPFDINDKVAELVVQVLANDDRAPTDDLVRSLIKDLTPAAATLAGGTETTSDPVKIFRRINTLTTVLTSDSVGLANDEDHEVWLPARTADINWSFWDRYRKLLVGQLPPPVVTNLDSVTHDILGRLEDPLRPGRWDRRGLVVGQVQSGKTNNYVGLVNKAIDAGYKFVIVLAGLHDSLRAQTQYRVDEGVIGKNSSIKSGVSNQFGVGRFGPTLNAISLTDSSQNGDFSLQGAQRATFSLGSDPVVLVVKKNATILKNLKKWIASNNTGRFDQGRPVIADVPMLLLDDEADSASINTADEEDPSTINRLIREILHSFTQSAYVGYTATPFANIFIDDQAKTEAEGPSLFPASFIVHLKPPSNYIGAEKVFGLNSGDNDPLPITRNVDDYQLWVPDKHKKDLVPGALPQSFRDAFDDFVLTCAIRRARGQLDRPNSMLVHVTRFVDVQTKIQIQISEQLLEPTRDEIRQGGINSEIRARLRQRWETDFAPTTHEIVERSDGLLDRDDIERGWDSIERQLVRAVDLLSVRAVNGSSKEGLDDAQRGSEVSVIAVGGDKLARGLTLPDLSVSYYLRASRMYDTLMQMGRWFGYRPRYVDVCRLHTTRELQSWYRYIATSTQELVEEFERMAALNLDPSVYGLRVRTHPDGLLVTARNKMKNGESVLFTYADSVPESKSYALDPDIRSDQMTALKQLVTDTNASGVADPDNENSGHKMWRNVSHETVVAFLQSLHEPPNATKTRPKLMATYVSTSAQRGKLVDWTVAIMSNSQDTKPYDVGGLEIGQSIRKPSEILPPQDLLRFKRLIDPTHEGLDLSEEEFHQALAAARRETEEPQRTSPRPSDFRRARPPERGYLFIYIIDPKSHPESPDGEPFVGYAVSFPAPVYPDTGERVEYKVNQVYHASFFDND